MTVKPVIFIVDDDDSLRKALKRLLQSVGFDAKAFASAQEFLSGRHHEVPGCLILDVRMPGVNGLELQAQLVASGSTMPVIFITAHEDAQVRAQAMKAGAIAFLQKPFDDEHLLGAISTALDPKSAETLP
jgi:FixJ family two-component response regulator